MQLRSLDIEQCPYPDVPATLTALTRLRLVSADEQNYAVFGSNLSALSQLKVRPGATHLHQQCIRFCHSLSHGDPSLRLLVSSVPSTALFLYPHFQSCMFMYQFQTNEAFVRGVSFDVFQRVSTLMHGVYACSI